MSVEEAIAKAKEIQGLESEYDIARILLKIESAGIQRGIAEMAAKTRELLGSPTNG